MDPRPYELPPAPILQALGTLLLSRSELEETLHFVIADEFTQHADAARALLAGLPFRGLIERFEAVYRDRFPSPGGPEEIHSFGQQLEELERRRDALIHTIWLQWDTGETQRANRRPSRVAAARMEAGVVTATDILALAAELDLSSNRLVQYWSALRTRGVASGAGARPSGPGRTTEAREIQRLDPAPRWTGGP
jgi:hypothetical protein